MTASVPPFILFKAVSLVHTQPWPGHFPAWSLQEGTMLLVREGDVGPLRESHCDSLDRCRPPCTCRTSGPKRVWGLYPVQSHRKASPVGHTASSRLTRITRDSVSKREFLKTEMLSLQGFERVWKSCLVLPLSLSVHICNSCALEAGRL